MSCGSISAQLLVLKQSSDTPASVMFLIREALLGDGCCCSACITSEQEPGNRPRIGETVAKRRISGETPIHSSVSALTLPAPAPGTLPPQAFVTLCATTASSTRQATCPSPETAVPGAGKSMWFWIFLVRRTPSRPAPGPAARWPGQPECVARG